MIVFIFFVFLKSNKCEIIRAFHAFCFYLLRRGAWRGEAWRGEAWRGAGMAWRWNGVICRLASRGERGVACFGGCGVTLGVDRGIMCQPPARNEMDHRGIRATHVQCIQWRAAAHCYFCFFKRSKRGQAVAVCPSSSTDRTDAKHDRATPPSGRVLASSGPSSLWMEGGYTCTVQRPLSFAGGGPSYIGRAYGYIQPGV